MNFKQIKYFQAVCEYGTIAEAANRIHISSPSISTAIKSLEEEYGIILFRRTRTGMEQTNAGGRLYDLSKSLMKNIDSINMIMGGESAKQLKIGIPPMLSILILPDIIKQYGKENPDVNLHIDDRGRDTVFKRLDDGEIDIAILPVSDNLSSEYNIKIIGFVEICAIVSRDKFNLDIDAFDVSRLSKQKLILPRGDFLYKELITNRFKEINAEPNIVTEPSQFSTILSLVRKGTGIGFALSEIIEEWMPVKKVELKPSLNLDICLIWRKNDFMFQSMQDFISLIEKMRFGY